jgi:eukaryotic-like serine/threonine-protein kinase
MGSGERPSRISELYHAALARVPEEREAFLREACADDDRLREDIKSLLGYTSDRFLESPAVAAAADSVFERAELPRDFGSYRLVAPLGSGGMGDVYRARDLKLGRDVALKLLSPLLISDPERRARFSREARLLATLSHPHIAGIYGLEEVDGITALVLELVEGPTLADRMRQGRLPTSQALLVARQIADALEAAHEKGIIHRDLKPSNIVLQGGDGIASSDVSAKVLDFGLAKPTTEALAGALASNPTMSSAGTVEGRILGTPAYMSPEQARGLTVDKRTDIWSFGCVLYEMLTGRTAFQGETTTDVMAAVVGHDPDWNALPRATPPRVRLLLARCLQKNPKTRLHDIGDARIELEPVDEVALGLSEPNPLGRRPAARSRFAIVAQPS